MQQQQQQVIDKSVQHSAAVCLHVVILQEVADGSASLISEIVTEHVVVSHICAPTHTLLMSAHTHCG